MILRSTQSQFIAREAQIVLALFFSFAAVAAEVDEKTAAGLVVELSIRGRAHQITVPERDRATVDYLMAYAAGNEAPRALRVRHDEMGAIRGNSLEFVPNSDSAQLARSFKHEKTVTTYSPAEVRISRVFDCRQAANCSPVRGLYAGRSPY